MGLDMYLYKKTYVKNWNHNGSEKQHEIVVKVGGVQRDDIKPERISYVTEEVGYWRKFNALHGWFVKNCGGGEDNCQEIYVGREELENLLGILKKVSKLLNKSKPVVKVLQDWNGKDYTVTTYDCEEKVKELLSPTEGFFFGSYEVDEYYKEEVERTIQLFEELLKEYEESKSKKWFVGDFYYQASW